MEYDNIPREKFRFANPGRISPDQTLDSRPVSYFADAFRRFRKNRSSVAAFVIILALLGYALIVPSVSHYDVDFRDGYYKMVLPRWKPLAFLGWDGCAVQKESQAGFDYYNAIGYEYGGSAVRQVRSVSTDQMTGRKTYELYVDSYEKVGFVYVNLSEEDYQALREYQNETGIQVIYPMPANYRTDFICVSSGANLWYELEDTSPTSSGGSAHHDEAGNPIYVPDYETSADPAAGGYDSLRLEGDTGGQDGKTWYVYAVKNQSGYKCRVRYSEYYRFVNGFAPNYLFGTNQHGQDIFVCLASGARLSFLLAIVVSAINFCIGIAYGSAEGYYGGTADLIMERIADILNAVPFIVVATLFQLHLAKRVGPVVSLLFAYVLTGWIPISSRVRSQFYRFKGSEYVLAARTLGAGDGRLIFRHVLPNSLGTIITGTILIIPGVIFTESMLSYLGIVNLESSGLTSIGTMLANGQAYLSTMPHIIAFPAGFIALLEISFNLFGNGLRDAFNPTLRGAEE